jgi:probable O-glycosylation ligase (exosortase A-associated)
MRDLLVLTAVLVSIPFILRRPWIGILMWSWIGYMNPHRLTWSFAYEMPLAQVIGVTTLVGFVFMRDKGRIPLNSTTVIWLLFVAWFSFTTIFALDTESSYPYWDKAAKIQLFAFLTVLLIRTRRQIEALVWVIVASIGFFGLKGGVYILRTGGDNRVYGPPDSFLQDNNSMALALIMVLPLMWYGAQQLTRQWQKYAMYGVMAATGVAILGSHSRGAALAGATMLAFLVLKSNARIALVFALIVLVPVGLSVMPDKWFDRMGTISSYQEDTSAMGRITAWKFAIDVGVKRPIGGGFGAFVEENYRRFSPEISAEIDERDGRFQGAHSIYFRVLGEHGFVGLFLFLALGFSAYSRAGRIQRSMGDNGSLKWLTDLARMLQVSIVGYAIGGAFLGLSYFDLYYHLVALVVILQQIATESAKVELGDEIESNQDRIKPSDRRLQARSRA